MAVDICYIEQHKEQLRVNGNFQCSKDQHCLVTTLEVTQKGHVEIALHQKSTR